MRPKFKDGDRVILTDNYYQYLKKGEVGILSGVGGHPDICSITTIPDGTDEEEEPFHHFIHLDYVELIN